MVKEKKSDDSLKGWSAIAKFLSQPVSTAQRWASEGMPVTRIGRYVAASPAELERWLTREADTKETVHIASPNTDLLADLKRGLSQARKIRPRKSRPDCATPNEMKKRNLRALKWLGTTPAAGVCTLCDRQFTVPLTALKRVADAQESLRVQFAEHKCKCEDAS